jgi:nicotinamidase/pyrazinamidase
MPDSAPDLVFWDVDTQFDFMTPTEHGGRLYVRDLGDDADRGAVQIVPQLQRLSDYAREHGILRVATGDWHVLAHREIDPENPDFRETYPPHCMAGERGSEKIAETLLRDPVVIPLGADPSAAAEVARRAREEGRDIFLQKEEFSCFTGNPATGALLDALEPRRVVVYGVALDVCVRHAVEGMLDRGERVYLVEDATWGLGIERREGLLERWSARGMVRVTTDHVTAAYPPPLGEHAPA